MFSSLSAPLIASILALSILPRSNAAAFNPNHPLKQLAHRSITQAVDDVSGQTFDFVIAGGGLAGLALAARLTEWSNITVAVIEAGPTGAESEYKDNIDIPGYSYLNSLTHTAYDWQYTTTPQQAVNDTTKYWPRGKGLGGSGAINGMFWVRASSAEYDAWNTLNPDRVEDWGWEQVTHYINKAENFTAPTQNHVDEFGIVYNTSVHGTSGPIQAGFCAFVYDGMKNWIPTWETLGFKAVDGHSGVNHGVSFTPMTLNPTNQSRSDSKIGYINPLPPRSNLVILTGYQVTGVTWGNSTNGSAVADGLEFMSTADGASGSKYYVSATKEVILAGGTVGSPQILQLSGVGPSDLLTKLGIDVVVDLPVGYNLQDHLSTSVQYTVPDDTLVWGNLLNAANASAALALYEAGQYSESQWTYVNEGTGYVSMADISNNSATFAADAVASIDANVEWSSYVTVPANVAAGIKAQYEINNAWLTDNSIGQLEIIMTMLGGSDGVGIQVALQHPYSRGTIMINSTSAFDKPLIDPNYLGISYDLDILQDGIAFARKLAATSPMNSFMITETTPGAAVTVDNGLDNWIRSSSGTEYHPLGTCSMQPQANGGVVDTQLIVYGTSNVRVIDASIIPLELSSHLMATTYGIAEKGADIIKAKYEYVAPVISSSASAAATAAAASESSGTSSGSSGSSNEAASSNTSAAALSSVVGWATVGSAVVGAFLVLLI